MDNMKVLMLGWEYPPYMAGGLGIATKGLSEALSKKINLDLLIPRSEIASKPSYVIDLNSALKKRISITKEKINEKWEDVFIPASGYDPANSYHIKYQEIVKYIENKTIYPFDKGLTYGERIFADVVTYANLALEYVTKHNFDIIHAHDWMTAIAAIKIKEFTGLPFVMQVHSTEFDRTGNNYNQVYQIEKYAFEKADIITPVSAFTGQIISNQYFINQRKIYPILNGVSKEFEVNNKVRKEKRNVLFLGRITSQKGPSYFIKLAASVIDKFPDTRFILAGDGDIESNELLKQLPIKYHNNFTFTGFLTRDKVEKALQEADIYCMPSVSEPFGLSALEAASMGIPSIISKQSGITEQLSGGIFLDFWDTPAWSETIIQLMSDHEFWNRKSKLIKKSSETFSWEGSANQYLRLYHQQVLKNKSQ